MLLAAGFIAYQLGKGEVAPGMLLIIATVVALVVAIQLVPHGPHYVRKPEQDLERKKVKTRTLENHKGVAPKIVPTLNVSATRQGKGTRERP